MNAKLENANSAHHNRFRDKFSANFKVVFEMTVRWFDKLAAEWFARFVGWIAWKVVVFVKIPTATTV